MKRIIILLALVAFLLPLFAAPGPIAVAAQESGPMTGPQSSLPLGLGPTADSPLNVLENARRPAVQYQMRINRRVVVRVSPAPPRARTRMLADLPRRPMTRSFEEVEHGDCVEVENIVGVQPTTDNRLLFFTNDDLVLAATLGDSCLARVFYAGFYLERNEDGQLCVARDQLQSRAGASCQVAEFSRLVAVGQ